MSLTSDDLNLSPFLFTADEHPPVRGVDRSKTSAGRTSKPDPAKAPSQLPHASWNVVKHLETIPLRYQNLMKRIYSGQVSPRQAVKGKCAECMNFEDVVNRVRGCTINACPLHLLRPYQNVD
jgi:hypothetical protein